MLTVPTISEVFSLLCANDLQHLLKCFCALLVIRIYSGSSELTILYAYLLVFFFTFCLFQTYGSVPNTLVIATSNVVKPRVAAAEHISQVICISLFLCECIIVRNSLHLCLWCLYFIFSCLISQYNEEARSPFIKKYMTIIHPGEVIANTELAVLQL